MLTTDTLAGRESHLGKSDNPSPVLFGERCRFLFAGEGKHAGYTAVKM
jgi:hypothetical protein